MRVGVARVLVATAACLVGLTGCGSLNKTVDWLNTPPNAPQANAAPAEPQTTGSIAAPADQPAETVAPEDPNDDLNLGKRHFHEGDYGLAERYFRRAVERGPGEKRHDAEAWLGLAASYDRLKRFELADRAYAQAMRILGPTAEVLNNQGYSYLLRGDYRRARQTLLAARAKDPGNPYIENNIEELEKSVRRHSAVR